MTLHLPTLWRLVRRDSRDQVRSHRFLILTSLASLLAPLTIYIGVQNYDARLEAFGRVHSSQADARSEPQAAVGSGAGLSVARPPNPASILFRGVDDTMAASWDFSAAGPVAHAGSTTTDSSATPGAAFDLDLLVRIILGLLAITLAADALAQERDSGTIETLLVQPLSPSLPLTAKLIGGAVALALAESCVGGTALIALFGFARPLFSEALLKTFVLLAVVAFLYLEAMYAIGLAIATGLSTSRIASTVAVGTWLVLSIIAPAGLVSVSSTVGTPPSRAEIEQRAQTLFQGQRRLTEEKAGDLFATLAGDPHTWQTSREAPGVEPQVVLAWTRAAQANRTEIRHVADQATAAAAHRSALTRWAMLMTPASQFMVAALAIAGTGEDAASRWNRAIMDRQRLLEDGLFDAPRRVTVRAPALGGRVILSLPNTFAGGWPTARPFAPPAVPMRRRLLDASAPLIGLGMFSVLAGLVAFGRFRASVNR